MTNNLILSDQEKKRKGLHRFYHAFALSALCILKNNNKYNNPKQNQKVYKPLYNRCCDS